VLPAGAVLDDAQRHAQPGDRETEMPIDLLAQIAAHQRRNQRAEIDSHVED